MRVSWLRRFAGRGLLRQRLHHRVRPIGECPRCGGMLLVSTECWLDAERVVTEHLQHCRLVRAVPETGAPVAFLRPA
jgi:hypothetical protein